MEPIKMIEDNTDELLQAVYLFSIATLTGAVSAFAVLPDLANGALFDLAGQFATIGDPAAGGSVVTWAAGLAVLTGLTIYVTNMGAEALMKPQEMDFDPVETLLAIGVFATPLIVELDVANLTTNHIAGDPLAQSVVVVLCGVGAFLLSEQ
jgi:hypothetical protein